MITITCDTCKMEIYDHVNHIKLGSSNGSLTYNNPIDSEDRRLIKSGKHDDVHFCNLDCFKEYFIKEKDERT